MVPLILRLRTRYLILIPIVLAASSILFFSRILPAVIETDARLRLALGTRRLARIRPPQLQCTRSTHRISPPRCRLSFTHQQALHHAESEVKVVFQACRSLNLLRSQTPDGTLNALKSCSIFHFIGHGKTDNRDQLGSSLILVQGDELTVGEPLETTLNSNPPCHGHALGR